MTRRLRAADLDATPVERARRVIQDDRDRLTAELSAKVFDQALRIAALETKVEELAAALHHTDLARLEAERNAP